MVRLCGTAAALAAALILTAGWVSAATPLASGQVIAVVQSARVDGQTGRRVLETAAPVFSGDHIVTGSVGEAQVRFRDNTKLVVGPNSTMTIDAFVFNDDNTARQISINAVRGTLRFITGSSRKDAYSITTPTATIGVRGTEFDVDIEGSGVTRVAVFKGITKVCNRSRRACVEQSAGCNISMVEPGRDPRALSPIDRIKEIQRNFRYIRSQRTLLAAFRVDTSSCNVRRAENSTPGAPAIVGAVALAPTLPPSIPPPSPPPGDERDRSGLSNGTNPGQGSDRNNSGNHGTADNPGNPN